ncbi:MAG: RMD1 family protein [Oligoflexia bacterium]|nr:RMD1 family protein [Oligoflexia bacterium]
MDSGAVSAPVATQNPSAAQLVPATAGVYRIKALHVAEILRLKDFREKLTLAPLEFSNYELIVRYSEDSYLFVYKYGSVVFFNVPEEIQERELRKLQECRVPTDAVQAPAGGTGSPTDVFLLEVQPGAGPGAKVYFDRIVAPSLSYQIVKIACMLLAESTALEYYEVLIENLLEKTNTYSKKLQRQGRMLESSEDLIKFIGTCLDTKQEIISNLYIVDSPDETWESVELDRVHQELKNMLEIETRYRALEYKIKIIQESVEVIVDLSKSKRETLLEMVIIFLIAFEIVLSILKFI